MKGREVREGREREGRGEIQPQQQAKQSKAKKKEEEEEEEEVRPKRERGKKGVPKWKAQTLVPTPQGAVNTHTQKRKDERGKRKCHFSFLSSNRTQQTQTNKKEQSRTRRRRRRRKKDAHRLVVDKKEGEQSHGKRGSGGGR